MKWLIWREYRQNQLILLTGVVLLLLPYLIAICMATTDYFRGRVSNIEPIDLIAATAVFSLVVSQLTVALLGGHLISGEKADRSAEYLAYLPLKQSNKLQSKLIIAFFAIGGIWVFNMIPLAIDLGRGELSKQEPLVLLNIAITGFTFFGVAWMISSLQKSPTFAIGGGLATPMLVMLSLVFYGETFGVNLPKEAFGQVYAVTCPIIGLICFSLGTWFFLQPRGS